MSKNGKEFSWNFNEKWAQKTKFGEDFGKKYMKFGRILKNLTKSKHKWGKQGRNQQDAIA